MNKTIDNTIYYTSGQFAKKAHVSVRTIRFYDQQNILKPSKLDKNGSRFYTDNDFVKLQQILLFHLKKLKVLQLQTLITVCLLTH